MASDKKPEDAASVSSSITASLDSIRSGFEQNLKIGADIVEGGLVGLRKGVLAGIQQGSGLVNEGAQLSSKYIGEGKAYVDHGVAELEALENQALVQLKGVIGAVSGTSPYITYPLMTAGALFLLPGFRRGLYRATVGRLRSPEAVAQSAEGRVEGLRGKVEECSSEATKLTERMLAAEAEMNSGISKLKATRLELQRLASVVAKSERSAAGVLEDLRSIKKAEKAPALRAEAASQLSSLRSQHSALRKAILRIAAKDI